MKEIFLLLLSSLWTTQQNGVLPTSDTNIISAYAAFDILWGPKPAPLQCIDGLLAQPDTQA